MIIENKVCSFKNSFIGSLLKNTQVKKIQDAGLRVIRKISKDKKLKTENKRKIDGFI